MSTGETRVDLSEQELRRNVSMIAWTKSEKKKLKERIKELDEQEEAAIEVIKEALGENVIGVVDGAEVVRYTNGTKRQLNQKTLKANFPQIAEVCTEIVPNRVFNYVGGNE